MLLPPLPLPLLAKLRHLPMACRVREQIKYNFNYFVKLIAQNVSLRLLSASPTCGQPASQHCARGSGNASASARPRATGGHASTFFWV
jgi:hypothetical protein